MRGPSFRLYDLGRPACPCPVRVLPDCRKAVGNVADGRQPAQDFAQLRAARKRRRREMIDVQHSNGEMVVAPLRPSSVRHRVKARAALIWRLGGPSRTWSRRSLASLSAVTAARDGTGAHDREKSILNSHRPGAPQSNAARFAFVHPATGAAVVTWDAMLRSRVAKGQFAPASAPAKQACQQGIAVLRGIVMPAAAAGLLITGCKRTLPQRSSSYSLRLPLRPSRSDYCRGGAHRSPRWCRPRGTCRSVAANPCCCGRTARPRAPQRRQLCPNRLQATSDVPLARRNVPQAPDTIAPIRKRKPSKRRPSC